jgi:hypothetical protein
MVQERSEQCQPTFPEDLSEVPGWQKGYTVGSMSAYSGSNPDSGSFILFKSSDIDGRKMSVFAFCLQIRDARCLRHAPLPRQSLLVYIEKRVSCDKL